jgi:hypothetical protein
MAKVKDELEQVERDHLSRRYTRGFLKFLTAGFVDFCKRNRVAIAVVLTWVIIIVVLLAELTWANNYVTDFWIIKLLAARLSAIYDRYLALVSHPVLALVTVLGATFLLGSVCVVLRPLKGAWAAILRHLLRVLCCVPILALLVVGVVGSAVDDLIESGKGVHDLKERSARYGELSTEKIPSFDELTTKIATDPEFYQNRSVSEKLAINQQVINYIGLQDGPLTKEQHFLRNYLNIAPLTLDDMLGGQNLIGQKWFLQSPFAAAYHMFGSDGEYNVKFLSADGRFEAVYNRQGQLLTDKNDPINMSTYNYASQDSFYWTHSNWDVAPYFLWGNTGAPPDFSNSDLVKNLERFFKNKDAQRRYEQIRGATQS